FQISRFDALGGSLGQYQCSAGVRLLSHYSLGRLHLSASFFHASSLAQSLSQIDAGFGETRIQTRGPTQFDDSAFRIIQLEKGRSQIVPRLGVIGTGGHGGAQFLDRRLKLSFLTKDQAERPAGQRVSRVEFESLSKLLLGRHKIVLLFERNPQVIPILRVVWSKIGGLP